MNNLKERIILAGVLFALISLMLGIGYHDGEEKGIREGKAQLGADLIVGLSWENGAHHVYNRQGISRSIGSNLSQSDALKVMFGEISPCVMEEYLCELSDRNLKKIEGEGVIQ